MSLRLAACSFVATLAAAIAACQSSAPYGTPAHAALATGIAAVGAATSRATGGCFADCLPGTRCNPQTGLCERTEGRPTTALTPAHAVAPAGRPAPVANASYPPGHEYDVPPASAADAGCDPAANSSDPNALTCGMDASVPY
jgi:hypothetical protein